MNISSIISEKLSQDIDFIILPVNDGLVKSINRHDPGVYKQHITSFPSLDSCLFTRPTINEPENKQLYPEEEKCISSARLKRRKEFTAGRQGARQLLRRYGINNFPLLQGDNREPIWPKGVIGSISHCDNFCVVITSKSTRIRGLGVDIEPYDSLSRDVEDLICTMAEKKWIESMSMEAESVHWSKIIFSAKESSYKCIYPLVKKFVDFQEAEIKLDYKMNKFDVHAYQKYENARFSLTFHKIKGLFMIKDQFLLTVAMIS